MIGFWLSIVVICVSSVAVLIPGLLLIMDMRRESRGLSAFAKELRRQRDEAHEHGAEFLAPRLLSETFKDKP